VPFSVDRADLRAWDLVVEGHGSMIGVEAETHIHDVQALLRRLSLKQRDGDVTVVILLLSETTHHREVVQAARADLQAAFPVGAREALAGLRRGQAPRANALVLV
jgi:hypothetical protein